jgi:hypothetical protein
LIDKIIKEEMGSTVYQSLKMFSPVIIRPHPQHIHNSWTNKNFRYDGTVKVIKEHYINIGAKQLGKERAVYVGFIESSVYNNLLMQGSKIMCYVHNNLLNCYIINMVKDSSGVIVSMQVAIYDDEDTIRPYPISYTIDTSKVDSMLITDNGYTIQSL